MCWKLGSYYIFILQHLSLFFARVFLLSIKPLVFFWVFWQRPKNPIRKSWINQGFKAALPTRVPDPTSLVEIFITFSLGRKLGRHKPGGTGTNHLFLKISESSVQKFTFPTIPGDQVRLPGSDLSTREDTKSWCNSKKHQNIPRVRTLGSNFIQGTGDQK